jgi:DNA-binding IclR family transcriptional regulator
MGNEVRDSTLVRAMRVIEVVEASAAIMSVSEIARRAVLPIATTHRIVHMMMDLGLLERDDDDRIRVGTRVWEISTRSSMVARLGQAARPSLARLHARIGHHTQLSILRGETVLYIETMSAPNSVINYADVSSRLPAYACSAGLVLLTQAPAELKNRVISGPLHKVGPGTPTTSNEIRKAIFEAEQSGFSICVGQIHPTATGIAVPIRNDLGQFVAALSVIIPVDFGHTNEIVSMMKTAAAEVTRNLDYHRPLVPASITQALSA